MESAESQKRLRGLPFPDLPEPCYKLLDFLERAEKTAHGPGPLLQDVPKRLANPSVLDLCEYHGLIIRTNVGPPMLLWTNRGAACLADWRLRQGAGESAEIPNKLPTESRDGPEPPDGFNYAGQTYHGLARKPFAALSFLWRHRNRTAQRCELAEPVWESHAVDVDVDIAENAIEGLRKEINRFFRDNSIPWHTTFRTGYLSLREGLPRKPKANTPSNSGKTKARRRSR